MITQEDMPKIIYLQIDDDSFDGIERAEEATWCVDRINDSDIEYMMVDKDFRKMLDGLIDREK